MLRCCNSVSWSPHSPNLLSAGFDLLRNEYSAVIWDINRLPVDSNDSSPSARNNSGTVDCTLHNFAFGEAISAISFLPKEENIVTLGTSKGWVRLYDLRTKKMSELSVRICDGDKVCRIKGIKGDQFSQNIAVFSDTPGDTVRILDLRLISDLSSASSAAKSRFNLQLNIQPNIVDFDGKFNNNSTVTDIAWSPSRAQTLAVSSSYHQFIPIYSVYKTTSDGIIRSPLHSISLPEYSKAISWAQPHLLVSVTSGVLDINVRERRALGFSPYLSQRDNMISNGFVTPGLMSEEQYSGRAVIDCIDCNSSSEKVNIPQPYNSILISAMMKNRVRSGYSIATGLNIQVLSDELDAIYDTNNQKEKLSGDRLQYRNDTIQLYKLWEWITRVEEQEFDVTECGIIQMFQLKQLQNTEDCKIISHDILGVTTYKSVTRSKVLGLCGWQNVIQNGPNTKASSKLKEYITGLYKTDESFERIAALAIWHGDIELAVHILLAKVKGEVQSNLLDGTNHEVNLNSKKDLNTRDITDNAVNYGIRTNSTIIETNNFVEERIGHEEEEDEDDDDDSEIGGKDWDDSPTEEYLHTISLVSVLFSGYHFPVNQVWVKMCENIIQLLMKSQRQSTVYLIAICKFLLSSNHSHPKPLSTSSSIISNPVSAPKLSEVYSWILDNNEINLEDRIGFSCNFVPLSQILTWLNKCYDERKKEGKLDGLFLTGLNYSGITILQQYLDNTSDIQTCALIGSRLMSSASSQSNQSEGNLSSSNTASLIQLVEKNWIYEYRNLLNKWEYFLERATLDVEIGRSKRNNKFELMNSNVSSSINTISRDIQQQKSSRYGQSAFPKRQSVSSDSNQQLQQKNSRQLYALPNHCSQPHVLIRCHYCATTLPLDVLSINQQQTNRESIRNRSVMSCCPNCKRQLPRCYICQLFLGLINPNLEFLRLVAEKRKQLDNKHLKDLTSTAVTDTNSANVAETKKLTEFAEDQNILLFRQWFFFCQRCKHGGHANCIETWFENTLTSSDEVEESQSSKCLSNKQKKLITCGVNGCTCVCNMYR